MSLSITAILLKKMTRVCFWLWRQASLRLYSVDTLVGDHKQNLRRGAERPFSPATIATSVDGRPPYSVLLLLKCSCMFVRFRFGFGFGNPGWSRTPASHKTAPRMFQSVSCLREMLNG